MSATIYWVHEDALNGAHPALDGRDPAAPVYFVWDDKHLESMAYSFQRLVFIYETLCEMNIEIIRGDTVESLIALARDVGADTICVADSANPAIQALVDRLQASMAVRVVNDQPFVALDRPPSLRRFFAYWKSARTTLMRP